ncbi:membrane-bound lytic murein transglycosylase MltF [Sulfurimonas sp. SAG-AH-194-C21]|nr:membrane-bound lytic murein transglycosylase MltF [Sulfurimonas sp. SAG-AH-194-C21]MDF1883949.1 membrane-bound lytic murein transglycosylase MltF [Sulfurimonas sp. SAG-AH-194-C21]
MKTFILSLLVSTLFFYLGWQTKTYFNTPNTKVTLFEKIQKKKRLDVIILNSPTVYYTGAQNKYGFEYELIKAFTDSLNIDLNLSVVYSVNEALDLSKKGLGDITVSGITVTPQREKIFKFGPHYLQAEEQLICSSKLYRNGTFPKDIIDLVGLKILVGEKTSYINSLERLKIEYNGVEYKTTSEYSTEELLALANTQKIDCTVADSNIFMINQRYYPNLSRAFVLEKKQSLAWILRKGDNSLNDALYKWLNKYENSGKMEELKDFNYAYLNLFDYYDNKVFMQRLEQRLPKYKKHFKNAAEKYGVPWELLAAQSYQESHWNPKAKSYTGVRGMMMLTLVTAKQMGIKNRLNAKQSIYGGAKYLAKLEKRFPKEIKGKNRWAFTLAAYNIGMGHIHDAQMLARKLNKNPYSWKDMKSVLPLLSHVKYYKKLKYGYARGDEPVSYVSAIQNYVGIILKD